MPGLQVVLHNMQVSPDSRVGALQPLPGIPLQNTVKGNPPSGLDSRGTCNGGAEASKAPVRSHTLLQPDRPGTLRPVVPNYKTL